jgi:hypothetical protein
MLNAEILSLDSNEFLFVPRRRYITRNLLAPVTFKIIVKNPLFEVISLHGPTGLLWNKNFLAR